MKELPIDKTKVANLTRLARHYDIAPIFLPNYLPEVANHPISNLLGELVSEVNEYLSVLSDDEIVQLINNLPAGIAMMIEHKPDLDHDEYLKRVSVYYVAHEVNSNDFSFKSIIGEDLKNSVVLKQYPELKQLMDKDGLLEVTSDLNLLDGGIEYREHILYYHQFLRRAYRGRTNFDFTTRFLQYYKNTNSYNTFRVAVDHQRIMPKDYYSRIFEFDTWYGPPFDSYKLDDPNVVGLTIIKRNPNSLFSLANKLERTEFFWSHKGGIKTLQIEELSGLDYSFDHYYLNRYFHSERDINRKVTRHLDGSVKIYLKDNYLGRFNSNIPNEEKSHKKLKLWRIDGNIELEHWIDLISFFYKGNEMIIEYADPKKFEELFELRVRDYKTWKQQRAIEPDKTN